MAEFLELLKNHRLKVTTAESCTGGMVAAAITDVSGSSDFFDAGVVTYANEAKAALLGVSEQTLASYGAVSPETACEMAEGVLKLNGADIAISVTGIAGPTGGTDEKPVGLVYIGLSGKGGTVSYKNIFSGDRDGVRKQTVARAFELGAEYIRKYYG